MFVKAKNGIIIRDPITKAPVPGTGREVPESGYWMRRLRDGDIVKATPQASMVPTLTKTPMQAD